MDGRRALRLACTICAPDQQRKPFSSLSTKACLRPPRCNRANPTRLPLPPFLPLLPLHPLFVESPRHPLRATTLARRARQALLLLRQVTRKLPTSIPSTPLPFSAKRIASSKRQKCCARWRTRMPVSCARVSARGSWWSSFASSES